MELTRETVYKIYKTIKGLDSKVYNKYFLLACSINKKYLEPLIEIIEKKASDIYTSNFVSFKTSYDFLVNEYQSNPNVETETKLNTLINENKEIIEEHQKRDLEFSVWVKEIVNVDVKQISFDHVPDELEKDVFDSLVVLFQEQ